MINLLLTILTLGCVVSFISIFVATYAVIKRQSDYNIYVRYFSYSVSLHEKLNRAKKIAIISIILFVIQIVLRGYLYLVIGA